MEKRTIESQVVGALLQVGSKLLREGDKVAELYGLNQQQFVYLRQISLFGPKAQGEISSSLFLKKPHTSLMTKKLLKLGLISKNVSEVDGRSHILEVTKKGDEIILKIMDDFEQWNSNWLKGISPQTQKELLKLLSSLNKL